MNYQRKYRKYKDRYDNLVGGDDLDEFGKFVLNSIEDVYSFIYSIIKTKTRVLGETVSFVGRPIEFMVNWEFTPNPVYGGLSPYEYDILFNQKYRIHLLLIKFSYIWL